MFRIAQADLLGRVDFVRSTDDFADSGIKRDPIVHTWTYRLDEAALCELIFGSAVLGVEYLASAMPV